MTKLAKNYELTSKQKKINITLLPIKNLIPPIYADWDRLSLAVSNLIENALRYTKAGGKIDIGVSLEKNYVRTVIAVYDAGLTSWMSWDAGNRYTKDAYDLEQSP